MRMVTFMGSWVNGKITGPGKLGNLQVFPMMGNGGMGKSMAKDACPGTMITETTTKGIGPRTSGTGTALDAAGGRWFCT